MTSRKIDDPKTSIQDDVKVTVSSKTNDMRGYGFPITLSDIQNTLYPVERLAGGQRRVGNILSMYILVRKSK